MKRLFLTLVLGAIFLGVSVWMWTGTRPYDDGIITTGQVVREIRVEGSDSTTYKPEIQFTTNTGETIVFSQSLSTSSRVNVGEVVRVSYRPDDPYGARNLDAQGTWMIWVFGLVGLAIVVLGAGSVFRRASSGSDHETEPDWDNDRSGPTVHHFSGYEPHQGASLEELPAELNDVSRSVAGMGRSVVGTFRLAMLVFSGIWFGLILAIVAGGAGEGWFATAGLLILLLSIIGVVMVIKRVRAVILEAKGANAGGKLTDLASRLAELQQMKEDGRWQGPDTEWAFEDDADSYRAIRTPTAAPEREWIGAPIVDPTTGGPDPFDR